MKNDKIVLHKEYSNTKCILNVCSLKDNPRSIEVDISEHFIAREKQLKNTQSNRAWFA